MKISGSESMEFPNRNVPTHAAAPSVPPSATGTPISRKSRDENQWGRAGFFGMFVAIVILIGAVIALSIGSNNVDPENKFVDNTKLQAVFLNTGQVYFGNIKTLNSKYFVVKNIYYLQTSNSGTSGGTAATSNANSSVSLVKLGCELHRPEDQMVINRAQVTFWENLGDNGQVAKAVSTFQKQNPSGQKCSDQSSSASTDSSNNVQSAGNSNTAPATTTPTTAPAKKP